MADENGDVWGAPVDENAEMVEMLDSSRQYQNLVETLSTAKQLMLDTRNRLDRQFVQGCRQRRLFHARLQGFHQPADRAAEEPGPDKPHRQQPDDCPDGPVLDALGYFAAEHDRQHDDHAAGLAQQPVVARHHAVLDFQQAGFDRCGPADRQRRLGFCLILTPGEPDLTVASGEPELTAASGDHRLTIAPNVIILIRRSYSCPITPASP
ncbi:hypothetical protein E4T56_gene17541, partial [Termitomyces sp. T112]